MQCFTARALELVGQLSHHVRYHRSMTNDSIAAELSDINNQLTSAHVALGNIYRRYGINEGEVLFINADDTQAYAAIEAVKSANAQLNLFLARLPSYD
jgi:hypothetical protein